MSFIFFAVFSVRFGKITIFAVSTTPKMLEKGIGEKVFQRDGLLQVEIHICKKAFITRFVL